jgi:preprotein translocase subunit SecG
MTTFVTIIFVIVALMMILSILLQAGKGGGLGTALGGGASQGVFGSGGGADFMSKLTQGFAATFMISAMYLAYASAHAGSEFLEESDEGAAGLLDEDAEINYERLGPRAQELPSPEEGKAMQAKAAALVPPLTEAPAELLEPTLPEPGQETDRDNSPDVDRGDSPQGEEANPPTDDDVREPSGESD